MASTRPCSRIGDHLLTHVLDATPDKLDVITRISEALSIAPRTTSGRGQDGFLEHRATTAGRAPRSRPEGAQGWRFRPCQAVLKTG